MGRENETDDLPEDPEGGVEELAEDAEFWDVREEAVTSGDPQKMQLAQIAVLARAAEWSDQNSDPRIDRLGEGHRRAAAGDWEGAETAYREVLSTAEDAHGELQPRRHLASLYAALGRHAQALKEARAATDAARRVGWETVLAMALRDEGHHARDAGDLPAAIAAYTEAIGLLPEDSMQQLLRAMVLTGRAVCLAEIGNLPEAEEDLNAAWPILEPAREPSCAAGVMAGISRWFGAEARVRHAQGDLAGAADAWREAVRYRRQAAQSPLPPEAFLRVNLADALRRLGEALSAAGDGTAAEHALAESRQIRRELGLPGMG